MNDPQTSAQTNVAAPGGEGMGVGVGDGSPGGSPGGLRGPGGLGRPGGRSALRARLGRSDAIIAPVGLGLAGVLVLGLGLSAGWSLLAAGRAERAARAAEIDAVGQLVSSAAAHLLASGQERDLSALRRLVAETAVERGLSGLRLSVPGGAVIADADPRAAEAGPLPATWGEGEGDARGARAGLAAASAVAVAGVGEGPGPVRVVRRFDAPGRGPVELSLEAAAPTARLGPWEVRAGLGVIAVGSMVGLGLAYRWLRSRLGALAGIRAALLDASAGERREEHLTLAERLGPEAAGWNALLRELGELRERTVLLRAAGLEGPGVLAAGVAGARAGEGAGGGAAGSRVGGGRGGSQPAESDLATACDALWQGVVLVDDQMRCRYLNGAAAVLMGVDRGAALDAEVSGFIADEPVLAALREVARGAVRSRRVIEVRRERAEEAEGAGAGAGSGAGLKGPSAQQAERRGQARWGGGVLRVSVRPVRRDDHAAAVLVIEDVTQQRAADEARNGALAQATHELRTPLTNMRLYLEQLIDRPDLPGPERAAALNVVSAESRRLERIVGDMLSVAEIEAGALTLRVGDVRLGPIIEDLRADFEAQAAAKPVTLSFDVSPKLPVLSGDRDKLTLAMHNLLGNAIKYTPAGGRVTVKIDADASGVRFEFADTGIGIKAEEQELIFDKFYRAKDQRLAGITGTGLGLSLARDIARLHGGEVTVQSELNRGSTFTLTVPVKAGPGGGGSAAGSAGGAGSNAGRAAA